MPFTHDIDSTALLSVYLCFTLKKKLSPVVLNESDPESISCWKLKAWTFIKNGTKQKAITENNIRSF